MTFPSYKNNIFLGVFFCPMGMPYTNFFRGLSDPPAPFSDFWLKIHFVPIHRYLHLHTTMQPGDVCARFAARNASLKKETYDSIGPRLDIRLQLFQRPTLNCRRIPEGSAKNPKKREKCDFWSYFPQKQADRWTYWPLYIAPRMCMTPYPCHFSRPDRHRTSCYLVATSCIGHTL